MDAKRFYVAEDCLITQYALAEALWDTTKERDARVHTGLADTKILDALEIILAREARSLSQEG